MLRCRPRARASAYRVPSLSCTVRYPKAVERDRATQTRFGCGKPDGSSSLICFSDRLADHRRFQLTYSISWLEEFGPDIHAAAVPACTADSTAASISSSFHACTKLPAFNFHLRKLRYSRGLLLQEQPGASLRLSLVTSGSSDHRHCRWSTSNMVAGLLK